MTKPNGRGRAWRRKPYGIPSRISGKQNPEYNRLRYEERHDEIRAHQRERRHSGRSGASYRALVVALLVQRDGQMCGVCGLYMPDDDRTIDHAVQLAAGGTEEATNLRLAHMVCNNARPRPRRAP